MYLIDANIIIRLLVGDEPLQKQRAVEFFVRLEMDEDRAIISLQALSEVLWIAEKYYELDRKQFVPVITQLLTNRCIETLEMKKEVVLDILREFMMTRFDFADLYLAKVCQLGELQLVTYDKQLAKLCQVPTLDQQR